VEVAVSLAVIGFLLLVAMVVLAALAAIFMTRWTLHK
jgi:hypothetical protein